ncbi:hypothetical protein [Phocaeicola dorei]|uniref:hypothetical protein n=1 Tax=Phocaeicola dorei TaxID=357276 RepID=UPI001F182DF8|nr:hypothetical protein [Phocaeicola dorei]
MISYTLRNATSCVVKWRIISSSDGGMGGLQLTTDTIATSRITIGTLITLFVKSL